MRDLCHFFFLILLVAFVAAVWFHAALTPWKFTRITVQTAAPYWENTRDLHRWDENKSSVRFNCKSIPYWWHNKIPIEKCVKNLPNPWLHLLCMKRWSVLNKWIRVLNFFFLISHSSKLTVHKGCFDFHYRNTHRLKYNKLWVIPAQ